MSAQKLSDERLHLLMIGQHGRLELLEKNLVCLLVAVHECNVITVVFDIAVTLKLRLLNCCYLDSLPNRFHMGHGIRFAVDGYGLKELADVAHLPLERSFVKL